ncbi:hypothetical protein SLS60_004269 [Paraconiothyrium brasiliense]|uniref:Uncharacterized protein n=1 Tax=Paraconiothyrium brasiliense TaxID=300254 RepID=A0ABR3RQZ9_9PLEO
MRQALEVKGDECRKLEETVEAHEERIEELVGKVILLEGGSLPAQQDSEDAATQIRRGNEQITQLQREVEELENEFAEEKKKNKVNKEAQSSSTRFRTSGSVWPGSWGNRVALDRWQGAQ